MLQPNLPGSELAQASWGRSGVVVRGPVEAQALRLLAATLSTLPIHCSFDNLSETVISYSPRLLIQHFRFTIMIAVLT